MSKDLKCVLCEQPLSGAVRVSPETRAYWHETCVEKALELALAVKRTNEEARQEREEREERACTRCGERHPESSEHWGVVAFKPNGATETQHKLSQYCRRCNQKGKTQSPEKIAAMNAARQRKREERERQQRELDAFHADGPAEARCLRESLRLTVEDAAFRASVPIPDLLDYEAGEGELPDEAEHRLLCVLRTLAGRERIQPLNEADLADPSPNGNGQRFTKVG